MADDDQDQRDGPRHPVILTVSRFDLARAFYGKLLPEFGMKPVYDGDRFFYCVGTRTARGRGPTAACVVVANRLRFPEVGLHQCRSEKTAMKRRVAPRPSLLIAICPRAAAKARPFRMQP
jgi:hypothetical protein